MPRDGCFVKEVTGRKSKAVTSLLLKNFGPEPKAGTIKSMPLSHLSRSMWLTTADLIEGLEKGCGYQMPPYYVLKVDMTQLYKQGWLEKRRTPYTVGWPSIQWRLAEGVVIKKPTRRPKPPIRMQKNKKLLGNVA